MRKSEFTKLISKYGYSVQQGYGTDESISITDELGRMRGMIATHNQYSLTTFAGVLEGAFNLMIEYASTPIEDREDKPKKYYIRVLPGSEGYLNIAITQEEIQLLDESEDGWYQTKFTEDEIGKLKQADYIAIDWDKVKFEEAE